jgi:hypothetical protein
MQKSVMPFKILWLKAGDAVQYHSSQVKQISGGQAGLHMVQL